MWPSHRCMGTWSGYNLWYKIVRSPHMHRTCDPEVAVYSVWHWHPGCFHLAICTLAGHSLTSRRDQNCSNTVVTLKKICMFYMIRKLPLNMAVSSCADMKYKIILKRGKLCSLWDISCIQGKGYPVLNSIFNKMTRISFSTLCSFSKRWSNTLDAIISNKLNLSRYVQYMFIIFYGRTLSWSSKLVILFCMFQPVFLNWFLWFYVFAINPEWCFNKCI